MGECKKCSWHDGVYGANTLHELGDVVQIRNTAVYRRNKKAKEGNKQ